MFGAYRRQAILLIMKCVLFLITEVQQIKDVIIIVMLIVLPVLGNIKLKVTLMGHLPIHKEGYNGTICNEDSL